MKITLEDGNSIIRIRNNESKIFKNKIENIIETFGGEEFKKSRRYTYYRIYEDILNRKEVM